MKTLSLITSLNQSLNLFSTAPRSGRHLRGKGLEFAGVQFKGFLREGLGFRVSVFKGFIRRLEFGRARCDHAGGWLGSYWVASPFVQELDWF